MPDRRPFRKRVHSSASGQASGQARYPGRDQRRCNALGHRRLGQILTGFHRTSHRSKSATEKVTLPLTARTAVSLKRSRDRICNLASHISIGRRHQSRSRVDWRCIYDSVEKSAELLLRIPAGPLPGCVAQGRKDPAARSRQF
jgi:hypothetical protein